MPTRTHMLNMHYRYPAPFRRSNHLLYPAPCPRTSPRPCPLPPPPCPSSPAAVPLCPSPAPTSATGPTSPSRPTAPSSSRYVRCVRRSRKGSDPVGDRERTRRQSERRIAKGKEGERETDEAMGCMPAQPAIDHPGPLLHSQRFLSFPIAAAGRSTMEASSGRHMTKGKRGWPRTPPRPPTPGPAVSVHLLIRAAEPLRPDARF